MHLNKLRLLHIVPQFSLLYNLISKNFYCIKSVLGAEHTEWVMFQVSETGRFICCRYSRDEDTAEDQQEAGWKYIHGDSL
eukprot:c6290_g1_i1 orf=30-269(+)